MLKKTTKPLLFFFLAYTFCAFSAVGQEKESRKDMMRDTLDGQLDMSYFLIDMNGFIPMPQLITEPALGNIGILFAPIFIKPNKNQIEGKYTPPDITAAFAGYTANHTWMVGGLRSAALPQHKIKYRIGGAYANVNLDFYRTLPGVGERKFAFNFKSVPIFGSITREIANTNIYVGLEYLYLHSEVSPEFEFDELPDFVTEKSLNAIQSSPGILVEFDARDNIFTPDKGTFAHADIRVNADWTGSDFNYENLHVYVYQYIPFTIKWVGGFRFETQQQFGEAPFYMLPGINLRGVPAARYQGEQTYLLETEQRYDFTLRWSGVAFAGTAKAVSNRETFGESELVHNYGVGFRYLLARLFKLRMGVDVAWSNDSFGYYITFGSAWR